MKSQTIEIKERPILFNTEMVKAILEGRKTQTRRIVKPQPKLNFRSDDRVEIYQRTLGNWEVKDKFSNDGFSRLDAFKCPYGKPGDRLWVRETWALAQYDFDHIPDERIYRADFGNGPVDWNWKPSIFMPREVSRILLEITDIRVERVQCITEQEAISEGVLSLSKEWVASAFPKYAKDYALWEPERHGNRPPTGPTPKAKFEALWDSINEKRGYGWDVNPWVWVVEFRKI